MTLLAAGLPLVAFLVMWGLAIISIWMQRRRGGWRPYGEAFLLAALTWGMSVTIITEGLSVAHALTFAALATCWALIDIIGVSALVGVWLRQRRTGAGGASWEEATQPAVAVSRKYASVWYISVGITVIILAVTGITANAAPPNNWDAMTYHLARVEHWIQNRSVGFYPTNDPRQLFDPPWAEYALLQFQLLTGSDHLANFVQWFSGLGICVSAPLIAQRLGANRAGQGLAMILAATTPMALLQSSSPQNDLVTSFWIACLVYFTLSFMRHPDLMNACAIGASLGLATLTKGTAYVFAAPVLLGLGIWLALRIRAERQHTRPWVRALVLLCLAGAIMLALNSAQYVRNEVTFHSPLGPDGSAYANQTFAPTALTCNAIRYVSLELGVSSTALNTNLYHSVVGVCSALNVSVNDTRISWTGQGGLPFHINPFNTYEGTAGNLAQFALILLALALVFTMGRLRARHRVAIYAALLLLGYVLFVSYIRWQPWGNRLLLPWFMAAAPLVGAALDRLLALRISIPLLELALLVLALPALLSNYNAPLLGSPSALTTPRLTQYFVSYKPIEKPYRDAAWYITRQNCLDVGFHSPTEGWEYPLWLLIGSQPYQAHIEHVMVSNQSARYASDPSYQQFHPCAIVNVVGASSPQPSQVVFNGTIYRSSWSEAAVAVYLPLSH